MQPYGRISLCRNCKVNVSKDLGDRGSETQHNTVNYTINLTLNSCEVPSQGQQLVSSPDQS